MELLYENILGGKMNAILSIIVASALTTNAVSTSAIETVDAVVSTNRIKVSAEIGKINEFSYPLMLKTLDRVVLNTNVKLSFIFQSGIKITV